MGNNNKIATGTVEGTGSSIDIACGFKPQLVIITNEDGECSLTWSDSMSAGTGLKELSNGKSPDSAAFTKPTIALTHNADPASNLAAAALYGVESGKANDNTLTLQSTTDSNADVLGETANGVAGAAASARFWVTDNDSPDGVALYVNEASSDRLEFVSPTGQDAVIIMPFEAAGIPGAAIAVTVHHSATAATGKALFFDDNGAADAQLAFVDTGAAGGTIPAADVAVILPTYSANSGSNKMEQITTGGVTAGIDKFSIGTDTDLNVSGETMHWVALAG